MDAQKLVRMANQIAQFFAAEPDQKVAVEGVAGHLRRFWEPRMRRQLFVTFDEAGGDGMHSLVVAALRSHRQQLEPAVAS